MRLRGLGGTEAGGCVCTPENDAATEPLPNNVMKNPEYGIREVIVLCNDNLSTRGTVTYAPIYMLMFIEKQKNDGPKIYKLDLGGLV